MGTNLGPRQTVLSNVIRGRLAALAFASSLIDAAACVPVFAQTADQLLRPDSIAASLSGAGRTGVGIARIFDAGALRRASVVLPPNLVVPSAFRRIVDSMLRWSPTFRRQCLRIANAPRMTVLVDWLYPPATDRARARTTLSTAPDGGRQAIVAIRPLDDDVELIAHEIEHVIEQLDEVDLRTLASVPTSGVHRCDGGGEAFETIRAIRAGLAAADEVRRHGT
jgi:hypothetical protein